jgi:hypothetical protein
MMPEFLALLQEALSLSLHLMVLMDQQVCLQSPSHRRRPCHLSPSRFHYLDGYLTVGQPVFLKMPLLVWLNAGLQVAVSQTLDSWDKVDCWEHLLENQHFAGPEGQ